MSTGGSVARLQAGRMRRALVQLRAWLPIAFSSRMGPVLILVAGLACSTTSPQPVPPDSTGSVSADPSPANPLDPDVQTGPGQAQSAADGGMAGRAEAAMEGLIVGTVVGGQVAGAYGAAVGAGIFALYGFITGDVPFESGRGNPTSSGRAPTEEDLDAEIEDEIAHMDDLEREIEEELRKQEELLEQIDKQEQINQSIKTEQSQRARQQPTDPLAAPMPPYERNIPASIYEKENVKTTEGERIRKTLDADRDGNPEIEILIDEKSGALVSRAEDTNYDGALDSVNRYENGQIRERSEDSNHDGRPDRWTTYENGRGSRVEIDRDFDGRRDGFKVYAGGALSLEEHDTNADGKIDRRVKYEGSRRVVEEEDRNHDGTMDFRTFFDEREFPSRTEADTNGDGRPDLIEYYEGSDPSNPILLRKEEDVNHDGKTDITSHYKKGKLVRKEVSDPDLI